MKLLLVILTALSLIFPQVSFAHSAPVIVKITASGFEPSEITIDSDTTLMFENSDKVNRWPASDIHPTHDIYPDFDPTKAIKPGENWEFRPKRVGTFKFHDHLFPHIKGVLTIAGESTEDSAAENVTPLNLQKEVDRATSHGNLRLKNKNGSSDSYIRDQMDYCFKNGGRDFCYKDLSYLLFYQYNLKDILDLLQKNENYQGVFSRCHELTHYLSRLAYQKEKSISAVYDQCSSVCHGGCYHGVIEQFLADKKLSITNGSQINEEVPRACGRLQDYKVPLLYDECIHGIGHGTMYINDGDLIAALSLCDLLPVEKDRQTCYSGAFMENSSSSTNLDHPSKFIKAEDPMYPCNILDEKYLPLCYRYQSSHFAIITQSNWLEVGRLCFQVPKEYQKSCFLTVGSNQVGFTQDFDTIISDCNLMPSKEAKDFCFQGAVDAFAIRYRDDFKKGVSFCEKINVEFQSSCFRQYGESVSSWSDDPGQRVKLCSNISNLKFANWCKGGQPSDIPLLVFIKNLIGKLLDVFKGAFFAQAKTDQDFKNSSTKQKTEIIKNLALTKGADQSWKFLEASLEGEGGTSGEIHDLAHLVGGLIFDQKGLDGIKFCTPSFAFGCFHGLLDEAFSKSLEKLAEAQKGCLLSGPMGSGPFASCIHGIGHGVASYYGTKDLENSLEACDKLTEGVAFCHDGVFMEFARNSAASFYRADDSLYPCNKLEQKYVFSCGRNQVRVMMDRLGLKFEDIAKNCSEYQNIDFQKACFTALGFDAVAKSGGSPDAIKEMCSKVISPEDNECIKAAAGELIFQNISGWQSSSNKLCQSLPQSGQESCLTYIDQIRRDYNRQ